MMTNDAGPEGGYGIFDGFEGYRTPLSEDHVRVLNDGLVVLDANVLLNLYRYNEATRRDLLSVMEILKATLWIPHQAMTEFWRNRESTLNTPRDSAKEATAALEKTERAACHAISVWIKKVSLPDERRKELDERLEAAFQHVRQVIETQADNDSVRYSHDTNQDVLLSRLASILAGRIGPALLTEDHTAALKEAERRAAAEIPPGYLDRNKEADLGAGDYLVWEQILREAEKRRCDVLFVTSDVKEDWWRKARGELRGPRLELIAELRERTGRQLFMLQPQDLLRHASSLPNAEIDPDSANEVERVDSIETSYPEKQRKNNTSNNWQMPQEIHERLLLNIYRKAHEVDWEFLGNAEKTEQYRQWISDSEVGEVLLSFTSEQGARVWLKDVPMKEYARAQEGFGPHAKYTVMRFRGPDEIVRSAFGSGWSVVPGSAGQKPMHCSATNGTDTRYVCWGPPRTFRDLVVAALNESIESDYKPAIVVTTRDGDTEISTTERERHELLAKQSGADLVYLHRSLIPNPEYSFEAGSEEV